MAPRAPLRNKLFLYTLALMLMGYAFMKCNQAPAISIEASDVQLRLREGMMYYQGTPFTGIATAHYQNGKPARETIYRNGKEDGLMRGWYPDGSKAEERLFVEGHKEGLHKGWWPDGKLKFEYRFNNDEHDGTAKQWFADGRPFRVFHYVKGHEDGLEQLWWPDGTIRANYVVKDGQQYGLIGRKLCRNVGNEKLQ